MSFPLKRQIYEAIPLPLKRVACSMPFSWLAGKQYRQTFRRRVWFDMAQRQELRTYQETELGKLLSFAVGKVPAYKHLRSVVEQYRPFEALNEFPIVQKDDVQNRQADFLPDSFDEIPHYETATGGTSGNQLKIFLDDGSQSVEMAFMHRQWARVGYAPSKRKATFRGVPFRNLRPEIYWQDNPVYNERQFSPFHMSERNLPAYVAALTEFRPEYIHGYPSAIDTLAEYLLRTRSSAPFPPIVAVLLGSEGVTLGQRERIERAFRARVYSWYGHSERVVLAGECEVSSSYHHFPDYGVLEIVDDEGNPCNREGDRGEIVGTGLLNYCMPLIRYRTGDHATRLESSCECGRNWDRFCDVEGHRKQEMVITKGGGKISLAALNMHGDVFAEVVRFQYQQDVPGMCTLRIVPSPGFAEGDLRRIHDAFRDKVGHELDIDIRLVEEIPLTARGKLKMLVSSLS